MIRMEALVQSRWTLGTSAGLQTGTGTRLEVCWRRFGADHIDWSVGIAGEPEVDAEDEATCRLERVGLIQAETATGDRN